MTRQAWLVAVGSGDDPLPDRWVEERSVLLRQWPIGRKTPVGIRQRDLLVYYAAHHQRLIALARATEDGANVQTALTVQVMLAVPTIKLSPDWKALGKAPEAIEGQRAILLTDAEYRRAWEAVTGRTRPQA